MKGFRNKSDGLWDIPIVSKLHENNFVMPKTHSAMHVKSNSLVYLSPKALINQNNLKYHHIAHTLQAVGNLADFNTF